MMDGCTPCPRYSYRFLVLLLLLGLQFQFVVPIGVAGIKLSASDPLASILALGLLLTSFGRGRAALWPSRALMCWLAAATAVLTVALVIGFLHLGFLSTWALGGKFLGWFGLGSYLFIGLWIGSKPDADQRIAMRGLIYTTLGVGWVSLCFAVVLRPIGFPEFLVHLPLQGFVGNRNAFVLQVLTAVAVLLTQDWASPPVVTSRWRTVLLSAGWIIAAYSASRSGTLALAALCVLALVLRTISVRVLLRTGAYAILSVGVVELLRATVHWLVRTIRLSDTVPQAFFTQAPALVVTDATNGSSDAERLKSYALAIDMWWDAPFWGSGLGSFAEHFAAKHGQALVIHNSALWLLTETGIIGLCVFLGLGYAIVRSLFPLRVAGAAQLPWRTVALMLLMTFAIMSLFHEMLYQRILWLMLGIALAGTDTAGQRPNARGKTAREYPC